MNIWDKTLAMLRKTLTRPPKERILLLVGLISLGAFAMVRVLSTDERPKLDQVRRMASLQMERAIRVLGEEFASRGQQFDQALDPNHTGLIGVECSDMVTTLGNVEAKRSTTNPNIAGAIVQMLDEAGVVRGDTIAVGCSGSFPALAVATLCATKALGVRPVIIVSLGSSSYGANKTDWTVLEILDLLRRRGLVDVPLAGVSLGGADDVGNELESETRNLLTEKIKSSGFPFLHESNLPRNVAERMSIYSGPNGTGRIAAFVNIGGSFADLGTDPIVLKLDPGVNRQIAMPEKEERSGVVFAMAKRHIPVIHLLHIKGLVVKYGLPWDPIPLPSADGAGAPQSHSAPSAIVIVITILYFSLVVSVFTVYRKMFFRTSP